MTLSVLHKTAATLMGLLLVLSTVLVSSMPVMPENTRLAGPVSMQHHSTTPTSGCQHHINPDALSPDCPVSPDHTPDFCSLLCAFTATLVMTTQPSPTNKSKDILTESYNQLSNRLQGLALLVDVAPPKHT